MARSWADRYRGRRARLGRVPSLPANDFVFRRWPRFIIVAALGLGAALISYQLAAAFDAARVEREIRFSAELRADETSRKLNEIAAPVAQMLALLDRSAPPDPALLERAAERAPWPRDPMRGLVWASRLAAKAGPQDQSSSAGTDHREQPRDRYPVTIDARPGQTADAVGFDLGSDPMRRAAIERARDSGGPAATAVMSLPRNGIAGFFVYWPVYRDGVVPGTVAGRRSHLLAVVEGAFSLQDVLSYAAEGTPPTIFDSIYFLAGDTSREALSVAQYSARYARVTVMRRPLPDGAPGAGRVERSFEVLGQPWTAVFDSNPAVVGRLRSHMIWLPPIAVLLFTALLMAHLRREQAYRRQVELQVAERNAELRLAHEALAREGEGRRRVEEQLLHAQKLEAIADLTGGIAHDFNNLLSIVIGNLDLLRQRPTLDREFDELSREALDAALRGADLSRQLLAFARRQLPRPEFADVNQLIAGMANRLRRTLGDRIELILDLADELWPIEIDPVHLQSSIASIAASARATLPEGGRVAIRTENTCLEPGRMWRDRTLQPGDYVLIELCANGIGAEPMAAFGPLAVAKAARKRAGLELNAVFGVIKQSGGHISINGGPAAGNTFRIYLPRANPLGAGLATSRARDRLRHRSETMLDQGRS